MLEVMVIYGIFTEVAVTSKNISLWAFRFGVQIVLGAPPTWVPPPPHLVKGSIVRKNFNAFFGLPMTF